MSASCYLTIDDSPSEDTNQLIDFLCLLKIPALFFVRGDHVANNPEPIIRAIKKNLIIGNHSFSHRPFGELSYAESVTEIEKCESEIDACYAKAGVKRPGYYFRFPYLDRGDGNRIERHFETVSDDNINQNEKVQKLQTYLKDKGFTQPFKTDHPLYDNKSIRNARDCLMTFTSYDWMLTDRHKGKWPYKNIQDLKDRIDNDPYLKTANGNILIFHDQPQTFETFKILIDHMLNTGYEFLSYDNT